MKTFLILLAITIFLACLAAFGVVNTVLAMIGFAMLLVVIAAISEA